MQARRAFKRLGRQALAAGKHLQAGDVAIQADHSHRQDRAVDVLDLSEITQGDKRVLVIGGEPVPYGLARIPQGSEIRGNLAAGGKGVARELSSRDREIAAALGRVLAPRGLLLLGLDIVGDSLTEINVTSPTCFREIADQTGCDVAALFIDALERALAAR
jgi:glutathione synthase